MVLELLLAASVIVLVDQASKKIAATKYKEGQSFSQPRLAQLDYVTSAVSCLGFTRNRLVLLLLWGFATINIIFLVEHGFFQSLVAQVGLGVAIGGATSNLLDRFWREGVIDFINLGFGFVFNFADVAILLGVPVALWFIC